MKSLILSLTICLQACFAAGQPEPSSARTLDPLDLALETYAKLAQRTVLRPSVLPRLDGPITAQLPTDTTAAIRVIESALKEKQIELREDGQKFVRVVPAGWSNSPAAAFLATIKPERPGGDSLPTGVVDCSGDCAADLSQMLELYGKLCSRTLLRSLHLDSRPLKLTTVTPLTCDEICYGLTVLLALNGIAVVDDGEKFVQLVPVGEWTKVEARAPVAKSGVPLLDPKGLPRLTVEPPLATIHRLTQLYRQFFRNEPPWTPRPVDRLVEFYAELTDQKAVSSESCGHWPVLFEVTTLLTKEEVCYAAETTLKLHGFGLLKGEGNSLRAIPLAELRSLRAREAAPPKIQR